MKLFIGRLVQMLCAMIVATCSLLEATTTIEVSHSNISDSTMQQQQRHDDDISPIDDESDSEDDALKSLTITVDQQRIMVILFGACLHFSLAWMILVTGDPVISIKLCVTIIFSSAMLLILCNLLFHKDRIPVVIKQFIANNFVTNYYDRDYGDNCELFDWGSGKFLWENLSSNFDEFIFYHFFGWIAKAMVLRNAKVTFIFSLLFELLERYSKTHLPNFSECWWDSLILDIFTANLGGILFGTYLLHLFKVPQIDYGLTLCTKLNIKNHDSCHTVLRNNLKPFASFNYLLRFSALFIISEVLLSEFFYFKFLLGISQLSALGPILLFLHGIIIYFAVLEIYVTNKASRPVPIMLCLGLCLTFVLFLYINSAIGQIRPPIPVENKAALALSVCTIFLLQSL